VSARGYGRRMSEESQNEIEALRREVEQLKAAQRQEAPPTKSGRGGGSKAAMWIGVVLLVVITFTLITIYDHTSGNADRRNCGYVGCASGPIDGGLDVKV
jgi:hypothetical protein